MDLIIPPWARLEDGSASPPSQAQAEFMRLSASRDQVFFVGGLGAGKTWVGGWAFLMRILSNRAAMIRNGRRGEVKYLAGAPGYQDISEGTYPTMIEILQEFEHANGRTLIKRTVIGPPREIHLITGDVMRFVALDPGTLKASNAGGAWLDEGEECQDPRAAYLLLKKRCRNGKVPRRFLIVTSTPGEEGQGLLPFWQTKIAEGNKQFALVHAETYTNPAHRHTTYYQDLASAMSAEEVEARLHGRPMPPSGTVYGRDFDPNDNVAWQWVRPDPKAVQRRIQSKDCEYWLALDWGGHFSALLIEHWPRQGPSGVDVIIDEHHRDGCQDFQFLDDVVALCSRWGIGRGDVAGVIADRQPRESFNLAWTKRYWPGRVSGKTQDAHRKKRGVRVVKWRLNPRSGPRALLLAPHLQEGHYTRGVAASLKAYQWKERRQGGQVVTLDQVHQDHWASHACDALRYYCDYRYATVRQVAIGDAA